MKKQYAKLKTLIAIGTFKQSEKGMKIRMEEKVLRKTWNN